MWNPFKSYEKAEELKKDLNASLKDFEQILKSKGVGDLKLQLELFQVAFEKRFKAVRTRLSVMSRRKANTTNREHFVEVVVLYIEEFSELFQRYFEENNTEHMAQSLALFLGAIRYGIIDYHFIGQEEIGIDSNAAVSIKVSIAKVIETLGKKTKLPTLVNIQARLQEMLNDKKLVTTRLTVTTQLFRDIVNELF